MKCIRSRRGSAITEYGAVLAFLAIIIAVLVVAIGPELGGQIFLALQSTVYQLNMLSGSAAVAS